MPAKAYRISRNICLTVKPRDSKNDIPGLQEATLREKKVRGFGQPEQAKNYDYLHHYNDVEPVPPIPRQVIKV